MMAEKDGKNRIANFSRRALSLRSGFVYGLFALLLAVALLSGLTSAWFVTESDNTENLFTAGTIDVEVESPSFSGTEGQIDNWEPGQSLKTRYTFINAGTKTMYLRASFEGFWKKYYHRNIAKVTAIHNNTEVIAYDSNYFYYGDFSPGYSPDYSPEATVGFSDDFIPGALTFPVTQVDSSVFGTPDGPFDGGDDDFSFPDQFNSDDCIKKDREEIIAWDYNLISNDFFTPGLNDPNIEDVQAEFGPDVDECSSFFKSKMDDEEADVNVTYYHEDGDFKVMIYKYTDNQGITRLAFIANYPVYHVYVKGGNNSETSGVFYRYYPLNEKGVYSDCGLSQKNGGWSHITFYYCQPSDDPKITIEKQISNIDSDNNLTSVPPVFNYIINNTGNVPLTDITVEDDKFGLIGTISYLPVGASEVITYYYNDWDIELPTTNVSFSLCDQVSGSFNPSDWVYHNGYFYYLKPIASNLELELCLNVTLDSAGLEYDGAQFVLYSYFEAVQTTNGLVLNNWADNPY
jgi:hypothetical protein